MTTRVGNLTVLLTETLLIQDGNDAWIEFYAEDWHVRLNIILQDNESESDSTTTITGKGDHGVITLTNFAINGGTSFPPIVMGQVNGKDVYISGFGEVVGDVKKITFQFYIGGDQNV
ncbi:hypothetical protein CGT81_03560 [Vibrio cholerae]|uniref:DUF6864 domain-containing function n=1 Tax=Vibrio cholerae TaxID=666 RepID=UPI000BA99FDA|nr:hypothetical protein [Vibrio cholerae]EGR1057292.1 hypothetical protein [Vibrio cholerae]KAA1223584.1 hypothetical protein F0Q18_17450 [Vibrio cholerae]PAS02388.1 hypothetical protein CGT81_03560 [Vibrio cholerae]